MSSNTKKFKNSKKNIKKHSETIHSPLWLQAGMLERTLVINFEDVSQCVSIGN